MFGPWYTARLILWRHFAEIQTVHHFGPDAGTARRIEFRGKHIESQIAVLLVLTVTLHTVFLQKRAYRNFPQIGFLRMGTRHAQREGEKSDRRE